MVPAPRIYWLKLYDGVSEAVFEVGTSHLQHGTQVWQRRELPPLPLHITERIALEEMWVALVEVMELYA